MLWEKALEKCIASFSKTWDKLFDLVFRNYQALQNQARALLQKKF